jgi:hypothetical protein
MGFVMFPWAAAMARYFAASQTSAVRLVRVRVWAVVASALIFGLAVAFVAVARHVPKERADLHVTLAFAASADAVRGPIPASLYPAVLEAQRDDSHFFIPLYWAAIASVGGFLLLNGGSLNRRSGWAVLLLVSAIAFCDLRENARIVDALGATSQEGPAPWGLLKWLLVFVLAGIMALPLLRRMDSLRKHARLVAWTFAASCGLGLPATLFVHALIPWAALAFGAGLFLLALLLIWDYNFLGTRS